ncbi:L,D-transpeptidase catalytic domain [Nocardia otitidiscaviarum]|uniref:L,D-transpeptidase catalytic domain n=1 Tax=Nocardia otitidiscaviarum TaxID=1823 RepID=A0A378YBK5_9NOCA|nr:L,D-transpeptidase family protein [Nocardia otitidiscaviarum]QDP82615.1 L,D-transpeptidase family protein [Nocardia otitidiscaviarum]SUA74615.1 L,D-transpeptidase catalytic domain [Nocardia otitidiscaviarum]
MNAGLGPAARYLLALCARGAHPRANRKTGEDTALRTTTYRRTGLLSLAATAAAGLVLAAPAQAAPLWPGGPDIPGVPSAVMPQPEPGDTPNSPNAKAPVPPANFAAPNISPGDGEVVGVAQPIIINFKEPVTDHETAEKAIRITSTNKVSGHFYWFGDKQVRWRPESFWPAGSQITVEAGGTHVAYEIGDEFIATADDSTHEITVTRNGEVVRVMPTSMGKPGHETPNGTYITSERNRKMIMDSSTYGVPVTDPEGYKLEVEYAVRMSNSGIFVHSAPWSVAQQGVSNASHGCLNVSPADAQWFFENVKKGDPVVVVNTNGGTLNPGDGYGDWN